jgi:peptide/nickel transport system permease protein
MQNYIIRRVLLTIPILFLVSIIVFLTIRLIPGNVVDAMTASMQAHGSTGVVDKAAIEHALGLDKPIPVQYGHWVERLIVHGDLGTDIWTKEPVLSELNERWPITLELAILALLVALIIALPIGIYSALRQDTWGDYVGRTFAILCIAVPNFWIGTLVVVFPAIWWGYSPPIMLASLFHQPWANIKEYILPAVVLGMGLAGITMRMTRTMMLEVLRQDYVRTAWAKGLRERVVVMRHALKNALIPVITIIGGQIAVLLGGDVIIEQIFNLPGLGRLMLDSISHRNYTVVSGVILVFALCMVVINLLVDLSYGYFDPRVTYK